MAKGRHRQFERWTQELYTYKYMAELTLLGFTSDCGDEAFIMQAVQLKAQKAAESDGQILS